MWALAHNSSRVGVGWLLSLQACLSLSRDRLPLCLLRGSSSHPSLRLTLQKRKLCFRERCPLPYLSQVSQICIFGGEIFRELELLGSYFGDPYLRDPMWLRKPPSLLKDALTLCTYSGSSPSPDSSQSTFPHLAPQEHIWARNDCTVLRNLAMAASPLPSYRASIRWNSEKLCPFPCVWALFLSSKLRPFLG